MPESGLRRFGSSALATSGPEMRKRPRRYTTTTASGLEGDSIRIRRHEWASRERSTASAVDPRANRKPR